MKTVEKKKEKAENTKIKNLWEPFNYKNTSSTCKK